MLEVIRANNTKRDLNFDEKLFKLKEDIFIHIQRQIADIPKHRTSPATANELIKIKNNCSSRGTDIALMNQTLIEVVKKQSSQDEKLDEILEKLDKKYAPMAAWTLLKWIGAILGTSAILGTLDKIFGK